MKKFALYAPIFLVVLNIVVLIAVSLIGAITNVDDQTLDVCVSGALSGAILSGFFAILVRRLLENDN